MEENLVLKLRDYSITKLEVLLEQNRFKRFARDINTKESLISERVLPYSRKEWLRNKIVISAFIFLANNNVGTATWFL